MASVWSDFDVYEEFTTRAESWDSENPTVTVTLRCKMAERWYVMVDIVGNYRQYPEITPVPLFAINGKFVFDQACKLPDVQTGSKYEKGYDALITITYASLKGRFYTQVGNEYWPETLYAEEELEPTMEFLTDDYTKYGWADSFVTDPLDIATEAVLDKTLKAGEEPGKAFYEIAINRTVKGYPTLPVGYEDFTTVVPLVKWAGYVHNQDYISDTSNMVFPAGTLLFTQPKIEFGPFMLRYTDITNPASPIPIGKTWKVSAKLIYKEQGWNAFWRNDCDGTQDISGWYNMVYKGCTDGAGNYTIHKPFKPLDMTAFIFSDASNTAPPDPWPPEAP